LRKALIVVGDCKATKLSYLAQFAENPFDAAKKQYDQIVNGVFQAWRYYSHVRRGVANADVADDAYVMIFTLDWFLYMSAELKAKVTDEAKALADGEGQITDQDRKPVVFCTIQELESVLTIANEDSFLAALKAAQEENSKIGNSVRCIARARQSFPARTIPLSWMACCLGGDALRS
jgi:hypothetical protein